MGGRSGTQLDDLARAVADGVPRRVVLGRIAAFMAAFFVGDPELALGARKRCPKGRRRCGSVCCKPGYVCKKHKGRHRCVCPKPHKVCHGRCVNLRTDAHNCGRCGHRCASGETCVAGTCTPAQQQLQPQPEPQPTPTCTDGVRNGNETDVDCGGPSCPKCADGKACQTASDCVSGVCTAGVCVAPPPACSADVCGAQHGCPPCVNGKACSSGADCASGHCSGGICVQCGSAADCPPAASGSCQQAVCAGGACGFAADDTNVPAGTDCTTGTCVGGTPSSSPRPAETPCTAGVCDGNGNCVGCVSPGDCPGTDTACQTRTCTSGVCGVTYVAAGTPAGASSCSGSTLTTYTCDGNGNVQQTNTSCAPYVCATATACYSSCGGPADCTAGNTCVSGQCVPVQCTMDSQCSVANGTGACNQGICQIGSCNPGYANCDGTYATGCETNLNTAVANCGTCGNVCAAPNATMTCISGTCAIAACDQGWWDCDGNPATGCESSATCGP